MKKPWLLCLIILLFGIIAVTGCTSRTTTAGAAPTPEATEPPTPSPTPLPSPIPYDLAAQNSSARFTFLQDSAGVVSALDAIRENAALSNAGGADETGAGQISSAHLYDGDFQGDIMVPGDGILYLLSNKSLVTFQLAGAQSKKLCSVMIGTDWNGHESAGIVSGSEKIPVELYYFSHRLAVLYDCFSYEGVSGELNYSEYTAVDIFDVSDPASLRLLSSYGQDGNLRAARLEGETLYLVTEYEVFPDNDGWNKETAVPGTYSNEDVSPMEAGDICFAQDGKFTGYSLIGAYELTAPKRVDVKALLGISGDALIGKNDLYFYSTRRTEAFSRSFDGFTENVSVSCTDIFRFTLGDTGFTLTTATVNGTLLNSGCWDYQNGALRLLTALNQRRYPVSGADSAYAQEEEITGAALYVLDEQLAQSGKAELPAGAEDIRWVGYLGDRAVISLRDGKTSIPVDLRDPAAPAISDALSEYVTALAVHSWVENGYMAFSQEEAGRLALTIYDSDFHTIAERTFGSDYSSTLENIRGYLCLPEENMIGFSADDSYCVYGLSREWGIFFREDIFLHDWAWNARAISLDGYFYLADRKELYVSAMDDLQMQLNYLIF